MIAFLRPANRRLISNPHIWTWVAMAASVLLCASIPWINSRHNEMQRHLISSLRNFRQARIDLAKGFLHTVLSGDPQVPFNHDQGFALIEQASGIFENSLRERGRQTARIGRGDSKHKHFLDAFRANIEQLHTLLHKDQIRRDPQTGIRLRSLFYETETLAEKVDALIQADLDELMAQHHADFATLVTIAFLLVITACSGVFLANRLQKQAGNALRRSESQFRMLVEITPDAILLLRANQVTFFNSGALKLFGAEHGSQLLGHSIFELIDFHAPLRDRLREMEVVKIVPPIDQKIVRFDGEVVEVEVMAASYQDEEGTGIQVVLRDITKRKQAETAIRERLALQTRLAKVAATAPGVVYSFRKRKDGTLCFPYISPVITELCGLRADELEKDASALFALVHPDDIGNLRASMAESARTASQCHSECRLRHPTKGDVWIESSSLPETDSNGDTLWHGILMDVTPRRQARAALKESNERFNTIARAIHDAVFDWDIPSNRVWWSEGMTKLFGHLIESGYADPAWWFEQVHPEDRSRLQIVGQLATQPMESQKLGPVSVHEYRFRRLDGSYANIYSRAQLFHDSAGNPVRMIGIMMDVTEQKRIERQIRRDAERLRLAMEIARIGAWELDLRTAEVETDSHVSQIFTGPSTELLRAHADYRACIHPEDRPGVKAAMDASIRGEDLYRAVFRVIWRDGSTHWVESLGSVFRSAEGEPLRILGVTTDITERKFTEQAAEESRERLRQVADHIREVFWMSDHATHRILYISPAYEEIWGRSREELYQDPGIWMETIHPEDRARIAQSVKSDFADGQYELNYRIVRPDGTIRWIRDRASLIRDQAGNIFQRAGVADDITDRRQLEEHVRQAQKMEAIGTLAGGIAHDFNNILAAILGYADLATMELPAGHVAGGSLQQILIAGKRAGSLIQQILSFSRHHPHEQRPIALRPVVEESMNLLRATLPATATIECSCEENLPNVLADSTQVHQALINLCTNAWHALQESVGRIRIELRCVAVDADMARCHPKLHPGPHVVLSVADTGIGMDTATQRRIFEPFFTTKPQNHGTGLGLSVIHSVMEASKGAILVESAPGCGSTFSLYFPATDALPETNALEKSPIPDGHGQRILYIDDEEPLVNLVKRRFELRGYVVSGFCDPLEAIAAFLAAPERFDVVVTDFNMPTATGLDVAREVLALHPLMPVILTSGYLTEELKTNALRAGIRKLVYKPTSLDKLEEAILESLTRTDSK